ncbi:MULTISPECIES: winged helix-turn-helix domain-containing protein [unclassified Lentimicrobium]|uniref:winged helix-turn-helix domain-containing protein n=1 Tax=unclassified Lentimicrobium TaxID=2677434 RepID=UPI0015525362|nr:MULTISPECIES: LysR family transcriptional regulator [unclassified Lentimicrobium]NPD46800.1 LysR family transcriptional regulator [Lentimicrobium sp. S6]NPD85603.1 LysR family transcriptional regulator [Lentimicrobium sp. L6]
MKPPRSSRNDVFLRYKLWLSAVSGEGIIEENTYAILKAIDEMGSLKSAAEHLGVSYRKAWGDIKNSEELLGYNLTEKYRGGVGGGASTLTPKAKNLLEAYDTLHKKMDNAIEDAYEDFKDKIL